MKLIDKKVKKDDTMLYAGLVAILGLILLTRKKEAEAELLPVVELPEVEPTESIILMPICPTGYFSYSLQRGDILWNLAIQYLGDGTKWKEIIVARYGRPVTVEEAKTLRIGEVIYIPKVSEVPVVTPSSTETNITTTPESTRKSEFQTRINQLITETTKGKYGTVGAREKIYSIIVSEFPEFSSLAGDIIYKTLPDGWETTYGLVITTPISVVTAEETPVVTVPTYPKTVTAGSQGARFRTGSNTSSPISYSFGVGYQFKVVDVVIGEMVSGENRWWKVQDGTFVWVGNTVEKP